LDGVPASFVILTRRSVFIQEKSVSVLIEYVEELQLYGEFNTIVFVRNAVGRGRPFGLNGDKARANLTRTTCLFKCGRLLHVKYHSLLSLLVFAVLGTVFRRLVLQAQWRQRPMNHRQSHIQAPAVHLWNFEGFSVCPLVYHPQLQRLLHIPQTCTNELVKRGLASRRHVTTQQGLLGLPFPISSSEKAFTLLGSRGRWCAPVASHKRWKCVGGPWTGHNDLRRLTKRGLNWSEELTKASSKYFLDPPVRNLYLFISLLKI
jgi:hypothetical protein